MRNQPLRHQVPAVARGHHSGAWIFMSLRAKGCSSSPSPSSGVTPRACLRDGEGTHGVLGPKEHVAPEEFPLAALVGRMKTRRARAASVRASYSHDGLAEAPKARLK